MPNPIVYPGSLGPIYLNTILRRIQRVERKILGGTPDMPSVQNLQNYPIVIDYFALMTRAALGIVDADPVRLERLERELGEERAPWERQAIVSREFQQEMDSCQLWFGRQRDTGIFQLKGMERTEEDYLIYHAMVADFRRNKVFEDVQMILRHAGVSLALEGDFTLTPAQVQVLHGALNFQRVKWAKLQAIVIKKDAEFSWSPGTTMTIPTSSLESPESLRQAFRSHKALLKTLLAKPRF